MKAQTNEKMVCKLEKSLCGFKLSARNWNRMLNKYLCENKFVQIAADYCVYTKVTVTEKVVLVIWIDDMFMAAIDVKALKNVEGMLMAKF